MLATLVINDVVLIDRLNIEFQPGFCALTGETGCRVLIPEGFESGTGAFTFLFSESAGRALVAVPRTEESRFRAMCEARGLPVTRVGVVDNASDAVEVQGLFTVTLEELRATSESVLPGLFG